MTGTDFADVAALACACCGYGGCGHKPELRVRLPWSELLLQTATASTQRVLSQSWDETGWVQRLPLKKCGRKHLASIRGRSDLF